MGTRLAFHLGGLTFCSLYISLFILFESGKCKKLLNINSVVKVLPKRNGGPSIRHMCPDFSSCLIWEGAYTN